jgi:hypothetical protein
VNLANGALSAWPAAVTTITGKPDFWLWFYLAFAISSTMLPPFRWRWLPWPWWVRSVGKFSWLTGPWMALHWLRR